MAYLRIVITAQVPLPKKSVDAATLALEVQRLLDGFEHELGQRIENRPIAGDVDVDVTAVADDTEPAPAPKRRKPRAALGSSPLANPVTAATMADHASIRPAALTDLQRLPPTTGTDGLSPEAGADPGPLSDLAAAALRQAGRS